MNDGVNDIKMAEAEAEKARYPLDSALWALREQWSIKAAHAYNEILKATATAGVPIQQPPITVAELANR